MDGLELFADEINGRLCVAIVNKGKLIDFYADRQDRTGCWASMYLGKVSKVDTKLDAAFVDLGDGLTGFLPAKHVRLPDARESDTRTGIAELLKAGQTILVQIKSEGKAETTHENQKLPRLTMKLYLPGLFISYSPNSSKVTISSRVMDEKVLARTSKLKGEGGWLVQAAAEDASQENIDFEARYLQASWQKLRSVAEERGGKPGLIKLGNNALFRALVDHGATNFEHIYVGNKKILDLMIAWCERHIPALATSKRLRLFKPEKPGQTLFDIHDIHSEMDALKDSCIYLVNGGSIIIEPTSAMTIIDVNQGSAVRVSDVNQQAALEVARQCRLRNLSGAILIDFINMDQKAERTRLLEALEMAFANDTGGAQVHGFTRLGIIELTRKRRSATLAEKLR